MSIGAAPTSDTAGAWFVFLLGVGLYFLPTIVAASRHVENKAPTFIVNLFLGWTLIGWVVALAMGAGAKTRESTVTVSTFAPGSAAASMSTALPVRREANIGQQPITYLPVGTRVVTVDARGIFTQVQWNDSAGVHVAWAQTDLLRQWQMRRPPEPQEKTCPRCAETVKAAAQVCRFCGHEFAPATAT